MENVFLLLGSNLGNRVKNLEQARKKLAKQVGEITAKSEIYETAPWGNTDQPAFLNQALVIQTRFSPIKLLALFKELENEAGKKEVVKWGPRVLDIDILLAGKKITNTHSLTVPHPLMQDRRFTLVPLAEIAPDFVHPILNKTIAALLEECKDDSSVLPYTKPA